MIIKEYRISLPLTLEEYHLAQLYGVAEVSKHETGGGEGVEVLKNEPFTDESLLGGQFTSGQYTYKVYHLKKKVPTFVRLLAPEGALEFHEESWNAYPYSKTVYYNPFMKESFTLAIESLHTTDRGTQENVHKLPLDKWKSVEVVPIDIVNDPLGPSDYKEEEDPSKFKSTKTGRGPLKGPKWWEECQPVMTCYKLVTCEFKWFGVQAKVERSIQDFERRIFTIFHRQIFCWMDLWYGLSLDNIRQIEDDTKDELDKQIKLGEIRGHVG
ncbi:phosphatidylinositol transfer protein alpha isoform-like [Palaemon carinicauda]|uniref:phosphatidylinositol transfer protein alpha isoform-like n=1 Tax=Palaemon carinicauda TaxID=392227 RepID=UPI0035B5BD02